MMGPNARRSSLGSDAESEADYRGGGVLSPPGTPESAHHNGFSVLRCTVGPASPPPPRSVTPDHLIMGVNQYEGGTHTPIPSDELEYYSSASYKEEIDNIYGSFVPKSKAMQTALENDNIRTVQVLIERHNGPYNILSYDIRAWSLIGVYDRCVFPAKEILHAYGIITDIENLRTTAQETLDAYRVAPDDNRRYLKRLLWGVSRLLEQWQADSLKDIAADKALTETAIATLQMHWQGSREILSPEVIDAITKVREQLIKHICEQWQTNTLSDSTSNQAFNSIIIEHIWRQWKQGALSSELAQSMPIEIEDAIEIQLLARWKKHDLPTRFKDGWKARLVELLDKQFENHSLDTKLDVLVIARFNSIIQENYGGRVPRNTTPVYEEAISQLIDDWRAGHLAEAQSERIAIIATIVRKEMEIPSDMRLRVEKEAIASIVTQFKAGQFLSNQPSKLEIFTRDVFAVFEDNLIPVCSGVSSYELYPLQQKITTDAISAVLADWRAGRLDNVEQTQLLTLLPEWSALKKELETQVNLASKHEALQQKDERIAELEKELTELKAKLVQPESQQSSSSSSSDAENMSCIGNFATSANHHITDENIIEAQISSSSSTP